jgi:hypothetical protein
MMKKKAFATFSSCRTPVIVLTGVLMLILADFAWGKSPSAFSPYPTQGYSNQTRPPGVEMSRRQQGSPQMDEDMRRNWKTYQGLTPDDKARLRDKSQRWQTLPPEEQQEMRRRMDRYRELPPQDQERYQKRYQQWQTLPPEDRNRIRGRLRNWDSLSPQEQEDVRQRFKKR